MAFIKEREDKNGVITYQVRYKVQGKSNTKTFPTRKEANKFSKEIEAQKTLGIAESESSMTFSAYAERVFRSRDDKASQKTKEGRKIYLTQVNEYFGSKKLKHITAMQVEDYFFDLAETKSHQVLSKHKQILSIVFKSAKKKKLISNNPMLEVEYSISQENINEVTIIDPDDFKVYLFHTKSLIKYYFCLLLLFYTGLRVGEALALRHSDFNFDTNIIDINKAQLRDMEIGKPKKDKTRTAVIHEQLSELLYEIKAYQNIHKRIFGEDYQDNNLVICNEDGSPITYDSLRMFLTRLDDKTGIKLRPHKLRHTFITLMSEMNPDDIKKLAGHEDYKTTLRYTHKKEDNEKVRLQVEDTFKSVFKI